MLSYHHPNASTGLLPTPTCPTIKSNNPNDFIKGSFYPIPYQAIIAVEGAKTHELLTWDINVTSQSVKVKMEWSVVDGSTLVKSDSIPKAVVNSISTYNLIQPAWSTSYSSKKFSLKCDWKLISSTNSPSTNNTYYPNLTPTINNLSNDSGYMSHNNSQSFLNASTPYHTPYPVKFPRHDVYRPRFKQPVFYPDTPSKHVNQVHQVNITKNSPQHTPGKPPVETPLSTSDPSYPPIDTPKPQPSHSPPTSPLYSPLVNLPVTKPTQSVPVGDVNLHDKPLSQSVPDVPPLSEFTHIEPPVSHSPPTDPSTDGAKKPKNRNKKKSQHNQNPPITANPTPSQTHPSKLTCQPSASNAAENPDTRSAQILPSPRKFVIAERSKDGDIITNLTPQTPEFDAQNEVFLDTPKNLLVDSDGLLDPNLLADRMNITGKCRLCNADVKSFNADLHLLECRRIDKNDIDNFAFEYADITNNSYDEIIDVIYNYCNYVMHDDDISYLFPKVSTFSKFFNDIELLLDQKASKVYKKREITGQQKRFNILNYTI